jgi:hypothetical protein
MYFVWEPFDGGCWLKIATAPIKYIGHLRPMSLSILIPMPQSE